VSPEQAEPFRAKLLAYDGATPAQIADEIAAHHDLATETGWTEALKSLAARPEVFRRLTEWLTSQDTPPKLYLKALEYVTANGVGKPIERHVHQHDHTHRVVRPPIAWSDEPPRITATATVAPDATAP
jgi:hypothetical protein